MRVSDAPEAARPETASPATAAPIELATVHALSWLTVACGVGFLMSILLLAPGLGAALGPLTFGRWAPLHLDLVLYGWLSLPLVGLLFRAFLPRESLGISRAAGWAVQVWSASLIVGAVSWLAGRTSGKVFLDWEGLARIAFLINLLFLAGVLAAGFFRRNKEGISRVACFGLAGLWLGLLLVPASMAFATSPATYPPINPETGGPTGASLLGSTLCVIVIFVATPLLLGLSGWPDREAILEAIGALAIHAVFFGTVALAAQGDQSHRQPLQIAAVASLLVWAWLLPRWLRRFDWPAGTRLWLAAFLAWGGALLFTAVPMFLPGLLDRIKFTNALVGHSHLAMAGMATAFAALLLAVLNQGTRLEEVLGDRLAFSLWNLGNAAQVVALAAAAALEAGDAGVVFRGEPSILLLYAVRTLAGAAMLFAAFRWTSRAAARYA